MALDQLSVVLQFAIQVVASMLIGITAVKTARRLARPVATYGAGLPERRRRPRPILNVPQASVGPQLHGA